MKRTVLVILGVAIGIMLSVIYSTGDKTEIANAYLVSKYVNTQVGQRTLRYLLHDECYFSAQYLELNKGLKVDMLEMDDDVCWKQADHTISFIKKMELP